MPHDIAKEGPLHACECEHRDHFDDDADTMITAHPYHADFPYATMRRIHTHYGRFVVCPMCALLCHPNHASTPVARDEKGSR